MPDPKKVFIVHGRNHEARDAMKKFLTSLGLDSYDFDEAKADVGGAAFILDIVKKGMGEAQAVIVLLTPDEYTALHPHFGGNEERWQSRPNVFIEAGMALAISRERTVLVGFGDISLPTDLSGIHIEKLNNTHESRMKLKNLLSGAAVGCELNQEKVNKLEWLKTDFGGDFEACVKPPALPEVSAHSPFL